MALLLHLLVAVLLPVVGSAHEAASTDQRTHVEEAGGSPSCPRRHADHECITCRLATTVFLLTAACRHANFDTSIQPPPSAAVILFLPRQLQTSPPSSRAPPVA